MEPTDAELIDAIRKGDSASFEPLVKKYQPRVFATVRRYARGESEAEDLAQDIFIKVYQKLDGFRGEAPFEHWLMRIAVRACYDFLRARQRQRETTFSDMSREETDWLDRFVADPSSAAETSSAARELVARLLDQLSAPDRLVITLLEIEERPIKEIAALTGWSLPLVKVRAFRARAEMRRHLKKLAREKYL